MKRDRRKIAGYTAGILSLLFFLALSYFRVFDEFEYSTFDLRFRLRPPHKVDNQIVIVHIGDDTIEKLGEWPIPRKYHAMLIKALEVSGVETIIFDVFFSEETEDDEGFAQAVKDAGNVYLPYVFEVDVHGSDGKYYKASSKIAPLVDVLSEKCKDEGFVNIVPDIDGKIRRVIPFMEYKGKFCPHITFLAVLNDLGYSFDDIEIVPAKEIVVGPDLKIPMGDHSTMLVNYPAKWGRAFRHYSYVDIIQAHLANLMGKEPVIDLDELKGTVCLIGFTATASPDAHPSPLERLYPGVAVHASLYNSIVNRDFIIRLNRWWNLLILIFLWVITCFVTSKSRRFSAFLYIGLIFVGFAVFSMLAFWVFGVWVDVVFPLATVGILYLFFTFKKYLEETEKRELLEKELNIAKNIQESFLPKDIPQTEGLDISARMLTAKQVGGDLYDVIQLDASRVGVMIGDVSGKGVPAALFMAQVVSIFKTFAEHGTPAEVIKKMNDRLVASGDSGLFVTLTYMIFDSRKKTVKYSLGGHLPTVMVDPDGGIELLDVEEGMPLALMETDFGEGECRYKPGSMFLLYTDGVTEAMDSRNQMYGEERLEELAKRLKDRSSKEIVDAVHEDVAKYAGKAAQHDDITVIAVRTSSTETRY